MILGGSWVSVGYLPKGWAEGKGECECELWFFEEEGEFEYWDFMWLPQEGQNGIHRVPPVLVVLYWRVNPL